MMKSSGSISLKTKLMLPIIFFTTLIFVVSQLYSFFLAYETQKENLLGRVSVLANGVAYNLQAAIIFNDSLAANEVLSAFSADSEVLRVKLYTKEGQLFAMYEREGVNAPIPTVSQQQQIDSQSYAFANSHIFLKIPVKVENDVIARLRVTISKSSLNELYEKALNNALIYFSLLVVAATILYLTIQKFIIVPVFSLNQGMRGFISRNQQCRIAPAANDEIGDLVDAFNTMIERLKQRDKQVSYTLDKLEEEKAFANEVVETVQHALIVVDGDGSVVHFNKAACDIFKCTHAYLKNANITDIIHTQDALFNQAFRQKSEFFDRNLWIKDAFNQPQLLQITCTALSKAEQMLFAIQDITEMEAAQGRQRLAAGVFENSHDGLMVVDHQGYITMVNPAVTNLLGYSQDLLMDNKPEDILDWQQFAAYMPTIKETVFSYGQWQGEIWEKHVDGHMVPMFVKVSCIQKLDGEPGYDLVYILSDLSNIKEMERLDYLAHHDSLTGLANRAHLYRVLDDLLDSDAYLNGAALLYIDLDGFKEVNDTYGHDAGDEVLKQVAERLLSQVRSIDLVARLSGDEFVVLIRSSEPGDAEALGNRLIGLINQDVVYKGQILNVGASVGVHPIQGKDESLDSILKSADTAMYKAKSSGKGRVVMT
ncbi:PAS domain S-box-containing protein/diguanylate cyclase (GGDEF) domain-containing protein [Vibrio xiamenensis]|uniref:PAS domain S-box-containing protein/diguanylate cyclase (GGDEF) domain-containing protein n=2 Tax=Vibrio xiamenensis TaxID=861298 RepID=A0A1G7YWG8_9VIBR|nr:PAS domain S-box-containing protein/diguanylate cyclase (GGDEF) domain-containing protein [Vibrio xiamenensis]